MKLVRLVVRFFALFICINCCFAMNIGDMADSITTSFVKIGKLMIGLAYVSGIGFGISAVFKFKQHKDNPTQIPVGTPFALLGVSCLLIFLPGIYKPAGMTIFGDDEGARAGGFDGAGAMMMPGSSYSYSNRYM
ncbi:MAG: type IV secretion protein IcmD [Legionellales bacterium]|nr:type IV secretion protein IcmD [Legionellales bacterium]